MQLAFGIFTNLFNTSVSVSLELDTFATLDLQGNVPHAASAMGCAGPGAPPALPVQGCIDVSTGFDVNGGADANFFGLLNKGEHVTLYKKKFELFSVSAVSAIARDSHRAPLTSPVLPRPAFF